MKQPEISRTYPFHAYRAPQLTVPENSTPGDARSSGTHPSDGQLAAYLDGELEDGERARLEEHFDICAECRGVLARTNAVLAKPARSAAFVPSNGPMRRQSSPSRSVVLSLATLAIAASVTMMILGRRDATSIDEDLVRTQPLGAGEGTPVLVTHQPANGAEVQRDGLRFIWGSAPAERFTFVLSDETAQPIFSTDIRDSMLILPDSVTLQAGRSYFWRVDAIGGGVEATTRAQRFSVGRPR